MKKLLLLPVVAVFAPCLAVAQTTPLSTSNVVSASFGQVEVTAGANGNISLGTDAGINYGAGYSGAGVGTAGAFTLEGDAGFPVEISCEKNGALANSFGDTLPISGVEIVADVNGTGNYGTGDSCEGIGTNSTIFTLRANGTDNRFSYGVRLDGSGGVPGGGGGFNTSNPNGDSIGFMFSYQ